ncbi:MAG TPA: hypothetical protein VFP12_04185, partial [Allosphingosinicella sp.]|nr:hypothetical protein [Allosphingosinicella sp.]
YLRLIQSGSDSVLQWDQDGPANGASWTTLAVFQNTDASAFTEANFGGFDPAVGNTAAAPAAASSADAVDSKFDVDSTEIYFGADTWFEAAGKSGETVMAGPSDSALMQFVSDFLIF